METTYEVHLVGVANGQEVRNTFGYRLGVGVDASLLPHFGAQPIAEEFEQEVLPNILYVVSNIYTAVRIEVYPGNSLGFLALTLPYVKYLTGKVGSLTQANTGPATYVTLRANLEPMFVTEGFFAPKRGWVQIGPLTEDQVLNGRLDSTWYNNATAGFGRLAAKMAQNLEGIDPPAIYYPVRLKKSKILGIIGVTGYSDILDWGVDPRVKISRSRLEEK